MSIWKNSVISPGSTVEDAIRVLAKSKLKIVLVCSSDFRLLGTITDGDIRRCLLGGQGLETSVLEVMCRSPKTTRANVERRSVLNMLIELNLAYMPVVNDDGVLQDVITCQNVGIPPADGATVFLLAGGFGRRLAPLTDNLPKPLINVGDRSIIQRIVELLVGFGVAKFVISLHYKADLIKLELGDGDRWDVDISYVEESEPLGTAGSLAMVRYEELTKPIIVMNSDILTKLDFEELMRFHMESGSDATICAKHYDLQLPYGVLDVQGGKFLGIKEKPIFSLLVNTGIYVIEPYLIALIEKGEQIDMPNFLKRVRDSKREISVFPVYEYWSDIGEIDQLNKAKQDVSVNFPNA